MAERAWPCALVSRLPPFKRVPVFIEFTFGVRPHLPKCYLQILALGFPKSYRYWCC